MLGQALFLLRRWNAVIYVGLDHEHCAAEW